MVLIFLVLQEVENKRVLSDFVQKYLSKAKYQSVVLHEGKDPRGIDVAVVSRYPMLGQSYLHPIALQTEAEKQTFDRRGVLEVSFQLPGQKHLLVYANHFPAPYHSYKDRVQGFQFLQKLQARYPEALQIAAGDFNVATDEDQRYQVLKTYVAPFWQIAHQQCISCVGSSYYPPKKQWSFLDMVLLAGKIKLTKVAVIQKPWMLSEEGFPLSFSFRTGNGASDHLPIYVEISL
ncbi:MAG: hypothetical protein R3A45_10970 [Bdellovibrionota bacterium]